jgi:hypothetical protein
MKKRHFLGAAALAGAALPQVQAVPASGPRGPALLTISGAIARPNRGPLDPALDQMLVKHKISFSQAYAFDFIALLNLPAFNIKPTLEYDARAHTLRGPLLLDVLAYAGARVAEGSKLVLRAVDGYAVALTPAEAKARRMMVATHLDGQPMALGGLGPLWAVCDADRVPELAARPLGERFAACPWGLYHLEVQA